MLRIGLTGGMGCGKSTIARIFSALGVPVYDADSAAKRISAMPEISAKIAACFGDEAVRDKKHLAAIVFRSPEQLARLNAIVHPPVMEDCRRWFNEREAENRAYAVAEAAVLFESGMDTLFDYTVSVEAEPEIQIARVMQRDNSTREEVCARISRQFSSDLRRKKADFIIENNPDDAVLQSVLELDRKFENNLEARARC